MKRSFLCRNAEGPIVDSMRIFFSTFAGIVLGLLLGISLNKMRFPSKNVSTVDMTCRDDNNSVDGRIPYTHTVSHIWDSTNPRGAERLPPGIIANESDLYPHPPCKESKYLVTFTVGVNQKANIDAAVKKFSDNFTIMLFHYDGHTSEWDEFEWSKRAIHVSAPRQTKWWYAKRFLHPDIVASFEYIFIWDEDLGLQHFDGDKYIKVVRKHNLRISQPGIDPSNGYTWVMTKKQPSGEVHKVVKEREGSCKDAYSPPCAAYDCNSLRQVIVYIYTNYKSCNYKVRNGQICGDYGTCVLARDAWRCVWHMSQKSIGQNDLVHGWGLDHAFEKCVEAPAHEKIGVVDSQWIVHQRLPSLGNQGKAAEGKEAWQGVRDRCQKEWAMFYNRITEAEAAYFNKTTQIH